MPDGTNVTFPDDMPKEQIKGMIAQKFPDAAKSAEPGFMDKVDQAFDKRAGNMTDILNAKDSQTGIETGMQQVGQIAGLANDTAGAVVSSLFDATAAPIVKEGFQNVGRAVANSAPGQFVADLASKGKQKFDAFAQENPRAVRNLAAVGNITEAAANLAPVVKSGAMARNSVAKELNPGELLTADAIKTEANKAYQFAAERGGTLKPEFTNSFIDGAQALKPQTAAGKIVAGESTSTQLADRLQGLRDQPLSLAEAQEIDETFGDVIDGLMENGRLTKEGKKVLDLQSEFRGMIDAADETQIAGGREGFESLKEGRRLWSKQAKVRDIEKIITRAEMTDNPATSLKTGFRNLYLNDKRMRGFTKEERALVKKAAESGVTADILRTFGSRLLPIGGSIAGGPLGAVAGQAVSMASRSGATAVQTRKANNLARLISKDGRFKMPNKFAKDIE
ncbi:hypothetical protein J0X19_11800 [Hymenobacter sp. BT186]|uniref:Uncharacterized protein n=1 Tax=Hymenobacter telluris TaxID=2816474 RepID=A0A939JAZ8_9BACT|nr:hypothetical protein [Hymenobacter telluris]MBO0358631.1 hypothetical protein [Hymenobacter telluris]